jgi:PAS domain S-box-containing protein
MKLESNNKTGEVTSPVSLDYTILESLQYPVCVLGTDGILIFGNESFNRFFKPDKSDVHLDWGHPFSPEYRKRIAQSYISALNGTEKQCFAVIASPDGRNLPVEIYLFPMIHDGKVTSILALMKIVDERLLSFDRSTLSMISEENFQYDSMHYEFSPIPLIRINREIEIIKCSHSAEGFLGFSSEEIIEEKAATLKSIFIFDAERIKKSINNIISGDMPFQRIGEIKLKDSKDEQKIVNLTLFPIIQENEITSCEIIIEDITKIKNLKDQISSMSRINLFNNISKGLLHSFNNTINVIMSKTQLLLQITEKESVVEGIQLIEESAMEIVDQIRRVNNFITKSHDLESDKVEPLISIIEDAIEFFRLQFKVEEKDMKRSINIERKYFSNIFIKTDSKLLREIIISIILRVSELIFKKGTIEITLKNNNDLYLLVKVKQDRESEQSGSQSPVENIFSGIDMRQTAERLGIKILEEESSEYYAIKAIFPARVIIDRDENELETIEYKLRDLDIIVVEDEPALQRILHEVFDKMGNRVFICADGNEALSEFKEKHYDMVITDYGIEGITGLELSARIKELDENTITVLLSGWTIENLPTHKNIVDLFMSKPFKLDDLIKNISKVFETKKKQQEKQGD